MNINNNNAPTPIYRKDYKEAPYSIDKTTLEFTLEETYTIVKSELTISRKNGYDKQEPLVLNGVNLELIEIKIDDIKLNSDEYRLTPDSLVLENLPETVVLKITTKIYPASNTSLDGLYKSGNMYCTQCEAEGFRKITYYLDRPDILSSYKVKIIADKTKYPILLSNGNLIDKGDEENNFHWTLWEDPFKKPSYLFAMVAGDLHCHKDKFTTMSGREIELNIYIEHENIGKTEHAMNSLKKSMKWDEDNYGLEYDLDLYMIVAVNDFNMGAMENKGLNIFNSKYVLAKPETATDSDFENIENVIAHEYFHNWTGNRVTCRDWFQLSLKEGLTVFRDQQFTADMTSPSVKRINDVKVLRTHQFPEDSGPMAHPVRPDSYIEMNNFYTVTIYNKGAEIIRMYETLLGSDGYYKGIKLYFDRHDGNAVTCDDFLSAMADANNIDLTTFSNWYSQYGTPEIKVEKEYDQEHKTCSLTFRQILPEQNGKKAEPFHIPVKYALLNQNSDSREKTYTKDILELKDYKQTFTFNNITSNPIPSLFRNFSAPIILDYEYSENELTFLMSEDDDDFNRWEATQKLATKVLKRYVDNIHKKKFPVPEENFIGAFRKCLFDKTLDKSFCSLMLTIPSESYLLEVIDNSDVDAIFQAREFLRESIAVALKEDLKQIFTENGSSKQYSTDAISTGKRSLKNLCLGYLTSLEEQEIIDICMNQFNSADNMTDIISALTMLSHTNCKERETALKQFYEKWHNDPLVVDKWFAIQAQSKRKNTLHDVQLLMEHPAFNITNPNKVRSLIGAFAQNNLKEFHKINGDGYRFIADQIIALNEINPQIAARLLTPLIRWKKFDLQRQELMKAELHRILSAQNLSKNVYEIASKAVD